MKIELEVSIPDGYEATGEYRCANIGDICLTEVGAVYAANGFTSSRYIILRKVEPVKKMMPMTHLEALYILTTEHCVCRSSISDKWYLNVTSVDVSLWEYGFVREDGTIDGPYKFEKEE